MICRSPELTYQIKRDVYFEGHLQSAPGNVQSRLHARWVPGVADLVAVVGYFTEHSHVGTPWTVPGVTARSRKTAPWRASVLVHWFGWRHHARRVRTFGRKKNAESPAALHTYYFHYIIIIYCYKMIDWLIIRLLCCYYLTFFSNLSNRGV